MIEVEKTFEAGEGPPADRLVSSKEVERPERLPTVEDGLRAAARLTVDGQIVAGDLDDATVSQIATLYDDWRPGLDVAVGDLMRHDGTVVECVQAHTTQADWDPLSATSLWKVHRTTEGDDPDEWVAPTGSHDAYDTGDRVTFEGTVYESTIDGNTWSPAEYPQGWTEV